MDTFNAGKENSGTEVLEGNKGGKIGIPYRQWISKKEFCNFLGIVRLSQGQPKSREMGYYSLDSQIEDHQIEEDRHIE